LLSTDKQPVTESMNSSGVQVSNQFDVLDVDHDSESPHEVDDAFEGLEVAPKQYKRDVKHC
jgi:hypothetical protein